MGIKEVIRFAFDNDEEIFKYFDPNFPNVKNLDDLVENIYEKIVSHEHIFETKFVNLKYGYFFYVVSPRLLISFGVNVNYRMPYLLDNFWSEIKKELGNNFSCFLWDKNKRAIKWLQKNGMKIDNKNQYQLNNHKIIKLCH